MKTLIYLALATLSIGAVGGCGDGSKAEPLKADKLASGDPNAKAKQLLTEFSQAEDPNAWVQQNAFALTVFDKVTDPQLKSDYQTKVAPLMGK